MQDNLERDDDSILKSLEWEYSLIQTKIDKYGDIAFKIKGFLIPIASASIYYILEKKNPSIPFFALCATVIFLWYETINNIHRRSLSERALFIEKVLGYKALRRRFIEFNLMPYQTPGIARHLSRKDMFSIENIFHSLKVEWRTNLLYYLLILIYLLLLIFYLR